MISSPGRTVTERPGLDRIEHVVGEHEVGSLGPGVGKVGGGVVAQSVGKLARCSSELGCSSVSCLGECPRSLSTGSMHPFIPSLFSSTKASAHLPAPGPLTLERSRNGPTQIFVPESRTPISQVLISLRFPSALGLRTSHRPGWCRQLRDSPAAAQSDLKSNRSSGSFHAVLTLLPATEFSRWVQVALRSQTRFEIVWSHAKPPLDREFASSLRHLGYRTHIYRNSTCVRRIGVDIPLDTPCDPSLDQS